MSTATSIEPPPAIVRPGAHRRLPSWLALAALALLALGVVGQVIAADGRDGHGAETPAPGLVALMVLAFDAALLKQARADNALAHLAVLAVLAGAGLAVVATSDAPPLSGATPVHRGPAELATDAGRCVRDDDDAACTHARDALADACYDGDATVPDACAVAASLYRAGRGGAADRPRALRIADRGCSTGSPAACAIAGAMRARGEGVPTDRVGASIALRTACTRGNDDGCRALVAADRDHLVVVIGLPALLGAGCAAGSAVACAAAAR